MKGKKIDIRTDEGEKKGGPAPASAEAPEAAGASPSAASDGKKPRKPESPEGEVEAGRPRVMDRRRISAEGQAEEAAADAEAEAPRRPTYVEELERKLKTAEEKLREHIDRINKEAADFRARQERELERRTEAARKEAVSGFLGIADDLTRATAAAEEALDGSNEAAEALKNLVQGVRLIQGRFYQELANLGVAAFASHGAPFDPERHEAVRAVEVDDPSQDGVVVEELVPGYTLGESILRPARVSVGKLRAGGGK